MQAAAGDDTDEYNLLYAGDMGYDPAPAYHCLSFSSCRRHNRRGSFTEHMIREQQDYLDKLDYDEKETEMQSSLSSLTFQSAVPTLKSDRMPRRNGYGNEMESDNQNEAINENQSKTILTGNFSKSIANIVCDVDMDIYQNMRKTAPNRCSTTRAA